MSLILECDSVTMINSYHKIIQTYTRICKGVLFYLSQNQESHYRTGDEMKPIINKPLLLYWTHIILRALLKRTWGEDNRELIQLVHFCLLGYD